MMFISQFQLSLTRNQLLRMYGVSRLHNLRDLNLAYNGILTIEALKECIHLTHLNLEGNQIKSIEHLNTNLKLEFLNLGENSIGIISDISFLKCLKVSKNNQERHNHYCGGGLELFISFVCYNSFLIVVLLKNFFFRMQKFLCVDFFQ